MPRCLNFITARAWRENGKAIVYFWLSKFLVVLPKTNIGSTIRMRIRVVF